MKKLFKIIILLQGQNESASSIMHNYRTFSIWLEVLSLEPRLSDPFQILYLSFEEKSEAARQNPEQKPWIQG